MTTKIAGGKISGLINLSVEAAEAIAIGEPVQLTDDYTVEKADGSAVIIGHAVVSNVKRDLTTGNYPVANVPGLISVEARGIAVQTFVAGANISAGARVGWNSTPELVPTGSGVAEVGIALMTVLDGAELDVLITSA